MPTQKPLSPFALQLQNPAPRALRGLWQATKKKADEQSSTLYLTDAIGSPRRAFARVAADSWNDNIVWSVNVGTAGPSGGGNWGSGHADTVEQALDAAEAAVWERLTAHERTSLARYVSAGASCKRRLPPRWDRRNAERLLKGLERVRLIAHRGDADMLKRIVEGRTEGLSWSEIGELLQRGKLL